ncbi:MAG: hypothetical protein H6611_09720 [Ignavibacteriales bacterium]|nr:hypothetical protein [Ignavibacteriales bacterium]
MIKIANIIFFLNKPKSNIDNYNAFKICLTSQIENYFSNQNIYKAIRLSYYSDNDSELGIIIYLRFFGIYQTNINYEFIFDSIIEFKKSYSNKLVEDNGTIYSRIAIKNYEIIPQPQIVNHLEKFLTYTLKDQRDENYDFEPSLKQIIENFAKSLKNNEYTLKCHRTTKFHDIDIKIWEARLALASGLTITSIIMISVSLEECFKIVLKSDSERKYHLENKKTNLENLGNASKMAEKKYGNMQLFELIKAIHKEEYINDEERAHLIYLKDYIRNAFIHSDKTKIFDSTEKMNVDLFRLEKDKIVHVEKKGLAISEMGIAHGMMQKKMADIHAKAIFYEVEDHIINITKRFWLKWKEKI